MPETARKFIDDAYRNGDFEKVYDEIREHEKQARQAAVDFGKDSPVVSNHENIDIIIRMAMQKKQAERGNR
jgi:hypothetical protein